MKKRDIILFTAIFCVLSVIVGSTYAYWQWRSANEKTLVFNTSRAIKDYIVYDEGDSHFVGDFQPSDNYCGGMSNTLSFSLNTANMSSQELEQLGQGILVDTIKMDVNFVGANTSSSAAVYWVVTSGEATSCTGDLDNALNYGTFIGVRSGNVITLLSNEEITTSPKTFTVWIWIDSTGSNLSSLSGETIDVNIWSQIDMLDVSSHTRAAGLYRTDGSFTSWDTLVANGDVIVSGNMLASVNVDLAGELVIATGITSIGDSAFLDVESGGCTGLTSIVIPDGVTTIGEAAFAFCTSLRSVVIPDGVTTIGGHAFAGCSKLTSVVIPDSVTSIGDYAFSECGSLTRMVIPNSVTLIGEAAFQWSGLTSVVIPDSVTSIGAFVFADCLRLTSVVIPDNVISIGASAFHGCINLTDVYYRGTSAMWSTIIIGSSNDPLTNATIHYNS